MRVTLIASNYPVDFPYRMGPHPPRQTKGWLWCDTRTGKIRRWKPRQARWKSVGPFHTQTDDVSVIPAARPVNTPATFNYWHAETSAADGQHPLKED